MAWSGEKGGKRTYDTEIEVERAREREERWYQRCRARPVKISSQARISAKPEARDGEERRDGRPIGRG